jgi:hypothetical protein
VPDAGPLDAAIRIHERVVELQDDAARRALTTRESLIEVIITPRRRAVAA